LFGRLRGVWIRRNSLKSIQAITVLKYVNMVSAELHTAGVRHTKSNKRYVLGVGRLNKGVYILKNKVKKLIGRSVVRLVAYLESGLDIDYTEYEKIANQASEINANHKCTFNRGPMTAKVKEILQGKEAVQ
jgi:hypothetical protein